MSAGGRASVLSGWSAARLQAAWTLRRIRRGRMVWLACLFALGPISFSLLVLARAHHIKWDNLFAPLILLAGLVPPLLSASVIADEFEDHTYTYLWARPLPRWSVLVGKLMATVPLAAAVLCVTAAVVYQVGHRGAAPGNPWAPMTLPRGVAAMAMAALAISLASGSIAVMMPRHGLGVAYAYLLVLDAPLGAMPFSIARLSITYHVSVIGGLKQPEDGSGGASALWLCGIAAFWLALGLWRLARSEFSSAER